MSSDAIACSIIFGAHMYVFPCRQGGDFTNFNGTGGKSVSPCWNGSAWMTVGGEHTKAFAISDKLYISFF